VTSDADDATFFNVRCAIYTRQSVAHDGDPALTSCEKVTLRTVEVAVAIMLILIAVGLGSGLI
jgi:hypothetical protein